MLDLDAPLKDNVACQTLNNMYTEEEHQRILKQELEAAQKLHVEETLSSVV